MTDLREGRIQAFLDEEMEAEARRIFMGEMARDEGLTAAVRAQEHRIARVREALDIAGSDEGDTEEALERVLARVRGPSVVLDPAPAAAQGAPTPARAAPSKRPGNGPRLGALGLGKAAALLLFATGVAAATVPGSPVRAWLSERADAPAAATGTEIAAPAPGPERIGIRLPGGGGPLRVAISAPLTGPLRVALVDDASLEVLADQGTSFSTSEGRIDVVDPQGAVTVRIPRLEADVSVSVGGDVYLRKSGDRIEVLREGTDSLPSEFIFAPPGEERPEP